MENFKKLGIKDELLNSLKELKFEKPTEIQEKAIPLVLQGKDIIAGAATGSGKTLVFGAAIIQNLDLKSLKHSNIQALVLTPTRELAQQVKENLVTFAKYKPIQICCVYGGVAINPQIEAIEDSNVVVGTPGRILDHMQRGSLDLNSVKILVLDEADRMLDMGFIDDVRKIISQCLSERQTMLFSATISRDISELAKDYMNNPVEVFAETSVDPSKLKQEYYDVEDNEKLSLLVHLLKNDNSELVMVFCNTQRDTDFVANNLKANGIKALAIHGGHSQNRRDDTMAGFHEKDFHVLVCTDVAARGLDVKNVTHIYNYSSPNETSQYIHRIGRTARAGENGKAVNLISDRDYENFGKIKRENPFIERQEIPNFERAFIGFKHKPKFGRGNFRGGGGRGNFRGGGFRGGSSRGGAGSFRGRSNFRGGSSGRFGERREGGFNRGGDRGESGDSRGEGNFRSPPRRFSRDNRHRQVAKRRFSKAF